MYNSLELKKILIKGLKVNYAFSYNKRIERILENKDTDTLEDLLQDLELMNLEEKTSKEMYAYIDNYFYKTKKEDNATVEIVVNEEEEEENNAIDKIAYINYISSNNYVEKQSFDIDDLELTDKQKEILNIYATTNSMSKTAEFLGVSKSTVQTTIERLRRKLALKSA